MGMQNFAFVVPNSKDAPQSRAEQIERLKELTRQLASEHVLALEQALAEVADLATQIVEAGEVFPVGVRQLAERLAEDAPWNRQTLEAIRGRTLRTVDRRPKSQTLPLATRQRRLAEAPAATEATAQQGSPELA